MRLAAVALLLHLIISAASVIGSSLHVVCLQVLRRNCSDPSVHFEILSNPEFLAEGTAMADLEKPDRVSLSSYCFRQQRFCKPCPVLHQDCRFVHC